MRIKRAYGNNMIRGFIVTMCLFVAISCFAAPNSLTKRTNELNKVNAQIKGLMHSLSKARNYQDELQQQLKKIEINIGSIARSLDKTHASLQQQDQILKELLEKQGQYQQKFQQQRATLAQQVRSAYMLGQHEYLKLLLNQKDPNKISRIIEYYKYITQARLKLMERLQDTINKIDKNKQQINLHTKQLKVLEHKQTSERNNLESRLHQRERVLTQVKRSINTKAKRLQQLTANKKALEALVRMLKAQQTEIPQPKVSFSKMRGKMRWPVYGKVHISQAFGTSIENTSLTMNGVFIPAAVGTPIHAVYPGKVVFANWLRGIGLLIIIEHGHGFMTLYGHAHSLYEKAGDYVKAGQVIASVGKSGGYSKSGLYFQIRDKGKPLNPSRWFK